MKILYDHQTFVYQKFGGISRYFVELVTKLNINFLAQASISCWLSDNVNLNNSGITKIYSIRNNHVPGRMTLFNFINRILCIYNIRKKKFDIFHPTYYDSYFLSYLEKKPFVITVYDMIHELYPGFWPNQSDIISRKKKLIIKASGIIAISENTKNDILGLYPQIDATKIRVIHLGNSFIQKHMPVRHIDKDYILFVGMRDHYKNYKKLVFALQTVFAQFPNIHLVCAGGGIFTSNELNQITELGLEKKVLYVPINDDVFLAGLYRYAILFVFPSLYEGFGIPILEAFSMECPVVLSKSSCFPEVASDAAEYFDGNSTEDIAMVLISLLQNKDKLNQLKDAGKKRLENFSWEKTAEETAHFYQEIVQDAAK